MAAALEKTYDGIIIGAGHHGLVLGSYLAKSGLDILVVDRRLKYGGGLSTEEATVPGFHHNLHSINHFHISETPWFKDLSLAERVTYITPRYELGQPHLDGTALVFGRDLEETLANVARFSKKDAQTFREWNRKAEEITRRIFLPERYADPLPQAEREALLSRSAIGREFLAVTKRQPFDVVKELFENEHVQLLFLFKVSLFGTWLVDTMSGTSPMGSVIRAFDLESGYQLCQGGSFNLARGLMETFIAAGGPMDGPAIVKKPDDNMGANFASYAGNHVTGWLRAAAIAGADRVDRNRPLVMASEDFGYLLQACFSTGVAAARGAAAWIGRNTGAPQH